MIVREATAADRDGIEILRQRCFPDDPIEKHFPPSRVFVAEAEGRPVAHLAFVDQTYLIDGVTHRAALATDAMTDPDFRRQGLFSRVAGFARDAIRNDYAFSTAWQIRDAVLPAMVRNGWEPVLRAPVFVRPLWGKRGHSGATPARVEPRSSRFAAPYYTSTANLVTREAVLKGHRTLCLVDLTAGAKAEIRAAMRATECRLAAALLSWRHPAVPLLLRLGFLPGPHRFRFLVNAFDRRIDPLRVRWALSWADTDHL